MLIYLRIVYACILTTTELSSCHEEHMAHKAQTTYYLTPKGKHLLIPVPGQVLPLDAKWPLKPSLRGCIRGTWDEEG